MLNRDFNALTVIGNCDTTTQNISQGSPLTLGTNGYKLAGATDKFAGLSFNYFNQYRNDVTGGEWFANSGKVGIVQIGEVTIDKDTYQLADGTMTTVYPYDSTQTYAINDTLYVNAAGLLTNDASVAEASGKNLVGRVVVAPSGTTNTAMKIFINNTVK